MLFNEFNFNMGRFIFSYLFEKYYKTFILPLSVRNHNFHYDAMNDRGFQATAGAIAS